MKLLVVDDDAVCTGLIELVLDPATFDARYAASGKEALELARNETFELFLLDVLMPEMSGVELLHALREIPTARATPVLFLTGEDDPDEVQRLKDLGALGVIHKPIRPRSFPDQLRALLRSA